MRLVNPNVKLLAASGRTDLPFSYGNGGPLLCEYAARTCYQSTSKLSASADGAIDFLLNLWQAGHKSVWEHWWATGIGPDGFACQPGRMRHLEVEFLGYTGTARYSGNMRAFLEAKLDNGVKYDGATDVGEEHRAMTLEFICDRGVANEIVRHRLMAYSQESTRYNKYDDLAIVTPESIGADLSDHFEDVEKIYTDLLQSHRPEIARCMLPTALKTTLIVTGSLVNWRHVIEQRTHPSAHPQMRLLMLMAEQHLMGITNDGPQNSVD